MSTGGVQQSTISAPAQSDSSNAPEINATKGQKKREKHTVLAPVKLCLEGGEEKGGNTVAGVIEVSVHTLPKVVAHEVSVVFPSIDLGVDEWTAVLTAQQSKYELVEWGDEVAKEKDDLLERVSYVTASIVLDIVASGVS